MKGVIYVSQSTDVALKTAYNMSSVIWEAILSPLKTSVVKSPTRPAAQLTI